MPNGNPSPAPARSCSWFTRFARTTSTAAGRPATFMLAFAVIAVWAVTGPMFHYSNTWQLIINTGTTIVTFLMVFLIQNTQNRDSQAIHVKLDELIRAMKGAHNDILDLDHLSDEELRDLRTHYEKLAANTHRHLSGPRHRKKAAAAAR